MGTGSLIARSPSLAIGSSLWRMLGNSRARLNQPAVLCTCCARCANSVSKAGWVDSRASSDVVDATMRTSRAGTLLARSTTPRGRVTGERKGNRRA